MVDEFQDTDQQQVQMIKSSSKMSISPQLVMRSSQFIDLRGADVDVFFRRQAEVEDLQPVL